MSAITHDRNAEVKQHFTQLFELFENRLNGKGKQRIHNHRKLAIAKLRDANFPSRRDEDWKYTSVAKILAPNYQLGVPFSLNTGRLAKMSIDGLPAYRVVFANGVFVPEFSDLNELPDGVILKRLGEAFHDERYHAYLESFFEESALESSAFSAINAAFARHGFFLLVPKNTVVDRPIHFIYLTASNTQHPVFTTPQIVAVAEANSEVTIIESFSPSGGIAEPYFTNSVNRFWVRENAHLSYYKIQDEGSEAFQVTNTAAFQDRNSVFSAYTMDMGGKIVRNNLSAILRASGTNTNFYGVYLPEGDQHIDNQTFIDHAFPHCDSNELYKGVIRDKGRGVFNGKVLVRQDAQKTNAFQQNSSLLLSERAVMDSKPQLEIFADDVKCSHGATIGQLDEAAIYYLRARGIRDEDAKSLLQYAFVAEVLQKIPSGAIKQKIDELVTRKLN